GQAVLALLQPQRLLRRTEVDRRPERRPPVVLPSPAGDAAAVAVLEAVLDRRRRTDPVGGHLRGVQRARELYEGGVVRIVVGFRPAAHPEVIRLADDGGERDVDVTRGCRGGGRDLRRALVHVPGPLATRGARIG